MGIQTDKDLRVDPANAEQLRAWDGDEGNAWAARADDFDRALAAHHGPFMEVASVGHRDRVLDVGCGAGRTTLDAARRATEGAALGVDLSSALLAVARRRAEVEGVANARFIQADAQVHRFDPAAFQLVMSRTGAMFFADPAAAFANLAAALAPGGRLVLLTWQESTRNEWFQSFRHALAAGRALPAPPPDAPGPFALADPSRVREVLTGAGFTDVALTASTHPMWFGPDPGAATEFVLRSLGWLLEGLDDDDRRRALDALHESVAEHATADGVLYDSAVWTITARRP